MLDLRTKLWTKKAEQLKNLRVVRANINVQEAHAVLAKLQKEREGLLSRKCVQAIHTDMEAFYPRITGPA